MGDLAASSTLGFAAELMKGTFKPVPNVPATEPKEVRQRLVYLPSFAMLELWVLVRC